METTSLKALAVKVLEGNSQGNSKETQSFPKGKNEGNSSKSFPIVGNQGTKKKIQTKAKGYRCGRCDNKIYSEVMAWETYMLPETEPWKHEHRQVIAWKCETCGEVYLVIGGTQGPQYLN